MSLSDPIADMLTRVRNANATVSKTVDIPHSNLKSEIARIMKKEGFIVDYTTEARAGKRTIRLYLKYGEDQEPVIQGLRRISKPGYRRYVGAADVPRVLRGIGLAILSTSGGVITDSEARKKHVGGEVLCYIW